VIGPQSFLTYARMRWLKVSLLLLAASVAAYVAFPGPAGRNGATVVGYTLGTLAALLMLWLTWFGVRKRRYGTRGAPVRGWLSAHVYLGTALLLLVPLHSGFEFGWNLHTLAYAVAAAVILSGFVGVAFYAAVPTVMTENRPGIKREAWLQQVADIEAECRTVARELPDFYSDAVRLSIERTRIGGGLLRQLAGRDRRCGTGRALAAIQEHREKLEPEHRETVAQLVELLARKQSLLGRIREDVRYKAWMDVWLLFHVPLALASLILVTAHVVAVFYW